MHAPDGSVRKVRFSLRSKIFFVFALVLISYALASSGYLLRYFFDDKARYILFSLHQSGQSLCSKFGANAEHLDDLQKDLSELDYTSAFVFEGSAGKLLASHVAPKTKVAASPTLWKLISSRTQKDKVHNFTFEETDAASGVRTFYSGCRMAGSRWLLLVVDASKALSPANELLSQMALLFVALLLAAFVISWFLARSLTSPLLKLTALAENLAAGNYVRNIDIKNTDELGALADTFGNLSQKLEAREIELEKSTELANQDFLTGLWNRRHVDKRLIELLALAKRHDRDISLIYMDADHFKKINDTHGHAAGDEVLKDFATLMRSAVRDSDLVARIGGEEFVVVLPETDLAGAITLAMRIRKFIKEHDFLGDLKIKMTASLGVESYQNGKYPSATEFLAAADAFAYQSKTSGRDRISHVRGQISGAP